ncbi:MAG: phosphatidylserine/phosphatidylglycerophosphate/cardiolipin synthase family protein [Alphaproteobacteria bacterium]|nr:phosphatidylserine/phosphatidylglycerophosphate/cardiolipin synthase family protein [Alphaproteobacteria bacterium]MCB9794270.1 phosphatidylserine/phosphatidylglycerophosphate/cardiolipin synthase family protein [Alphaproteobacteria bacterium]
MILPPFPGALLLHDAQRSPERALALAKALVAPGGTLLLRGQLAPLSAAERWLSPDPWSTLAQRLEAAEREVGQLAARLRSEGWQALVELSVVPDAEDISRDLARLGAPLVIVSPELEPERKRAWIELALEEGRVLAIPGEEPPQVPRHVLLPLALGPLRTRARPGLASELTGQRVTVLEVQDGEGLQRKERTWDGEVRLQRLTAPLGQWMESLAALIHEESVDLVLAPTPSLGELGRGALARALSALDEASPVPVLLAVGAGELAAVSHALEASDLLLIGDALIGAVERRSALGAASPAEGEVLARDAHQRRWTGRVQSGRVRLPLSPEDLDALPEALGLSDAADPERATALVRVLRAPAEPFGLAAASRFPVDRAACPWWAVRLDPERPLSELEVLTEDDPLLDAEALLDDGPHQDLPPEAEQLRLERLARRMRAAGLPVRRLVGPRGQRSLPPLLRDPLAELCDAPPSSASAFTLDLDNRDARERMLDCIRGAQRCVHLQVYMVYDDPVARGIAQALIEAAERGVRVRVLVDSLLSLHGSLGQENPVLIGLAAHRNAEVRAWRPVQQVPGLTELKQRDHRKLLIADGARALIGGRNLGAPYLTAFEEVRLGPETPFRDVPWLDASAEVQGPVAVEVERTFLHAWVASGGEAFSLPEPPPPGPLPARLITHVGLQDTHTLDLYRRLIEQAQERVLIVNTFPLCHELQRALRRALERGVRVRLLVGNVRPLHGDRQPFPGGVIRELATQVIHGRIDPLVEAGAEAWELAVDGGPALGRVLPHVHAKLVCVDGQRLSVGSANLDVTAAYWESEALLLLEHPPSVQAVEAQLEALLERSLRVDPADPLWQQRAARRGWLAQAWPGVVG